MSKKQGHVGIMLSAGESVLTISGRETTPFPKLNFNTNSGATRTYKAVQKWLIDNAIEEAESRRDHFNLDYFKSINLKDISQSDIESASEYIFELSERFANE